MSRLAERRSGCRIVIPDGLGSARLAAIFEDEFSGIPDFLLHRDSPSGSSELVARLAACEVAILTFGGAKLSSTSLSALERLRLVVVAGPLGDAVDLSDARERRIEVRCVSQAALGPVAEMTIGLILAVARRLVLLHDGVRHGRWPDIPGVELAGKTLGLVGLGAIGQRVARLAGAFEMKRIAWSPHLTTERAEAAGAERVSLDDLMSRSDVVSLHLRLGHDTHGILDAHRLGQMRKTAILINTARASLIDEEALWRLLKEGTIAGAGLDVFADEPLGRTHRWQELDNVVLTPHAAWNTEDTLRRWVRGAAEHVQRYLQARASESAVDGP